MTDQSKQTINFHNKTNLPIMVEGWVRISHYLNSLEGIIIYPNTECMVTSITGEWYMNTMFMEIELSNMWNSAGFFDYTIGKFKSEPCINGNYSWMYNNHFDAIYDNNTIVFDYKCDDILK